ncbi:dynein light chain [Pyrus ussuriensis x Pyrus communis]|uniref:Dynein light chain n=1 Tax=Pyrus ussuriensis x Pyrus communis TaxID=2448454 RepID=A0A5N5HRX5_9ROSA|nr:dynein light chain [Pyrus ussuriensis x Pyrus communis]
MAYKALDLYEVSDFRSVAHYIKQLQLFLSAKLSCQSQATYQSFPRETKEFLVFKDCKNSTESREEAGSTAD